MLCHHIFGPVPSRRLGVSLGVDLLTHKICSMDCVYCECGKTTQQTLDRAEYVLFSRIQQELDHYFRRHRDPDVITFSGSGEPTLNIHIGKVIQYIKQKKPDIPVAVLTNASLLHDPDVFTALLAADIVIPSLDAVLVSTFKKMNNPHPDLDPEEILNGIERFSKACHSYQAYKGKLWLEIFVLPGFNDTRPDLDALRKAVLRIKPDRVQLNTLDRPGALPDILPASPEALESASRKLGIDNCDILARVHPDTEAKINRKDVKAAILETICRRPSTLEDLKKMINVETPVIHFYLKRLEKENRIAGKKQARGIFYQTLKVNPK